MSLLYSESVSAAKPPVAIRITRPYDSEDELGRHELDTISRTGVVLVGAQPRPEGVILRFELALASGTPVLRGEGRVIGYKSAVVGSEPGLAVRFTRLDSKSKALVDRVAALREMRRSVPPPPAMPQEPEVAANEPPPPPVSAPEIPIAVASSSDALPASAPEPAPPAPAPAPPSTPQPTIARAMDREAVLARLRERSARIDAARVTEILETGASRRRRA